MYKKGDIILILFPFTDQKGDKYRPAIILGTSKDHVVAIFITSSDAKNTWNVPVDATEKTGLHVKSFIRCDKVSSFDTRIVQGLIGSVPASTLKQVDIKIKKLFKV